MYYFNLCRYYDWHSQSAQESSTNVGRVSPYSCPYTLRRMLRVSLSLFLKQGSNELDSSSSRDMSSLVILRFAQDDTVELFILSRTLLNIEPCLSYTLSIGIFETVQRSLGLATSNCTIEIASVGQRTIHRPHRIHFSSSIIISAPPRHDSVP